MQQRKTQLGNTVLGDVGTPGGGKTSGDAALAAAMQEAEEAGEEVEETESRKMDAATMSALIENALGLFSK